MKDEKRQNQNKGSDNSADNTKFYAENVLKMGTTIFG